MLMASSMVMDALLPHSLSIFLERFVLIVP